MISRTSLIFVAHYANYLKLIDKVTELADSEEISVNLSQKEQWYTSHNKSLNVIKYLFMSFSREACHLLFNYNIDGSLLQWSITFVDLGIYIDSHLTVIRHIDYVGSKGFGKLGSKFKLGRGVFWKLWNRLLLSLNLNMRHQFGTHIKTFMFISNYQQHEPTFWYIPLTCNVFFNQIYIFDWSLIA